MHSRTGRSGPSVPTSPSRSTSEWLLPTNKDLAAEVKANRFRPDLYYRLQVVPITLPPLRERRSDIPLLIEHFLQRHNAARPFPITISEEAMVLLWEYDWAGNIRELENVIERLVILSDSPVIRPDTLPPHIRSFLSEKKIPSPTLGEEGMDLNAAVEEFEKPHDRRGAAPNQR